MEHHKFMAWDGVDYMSKPFTLHDIVTRKIEFTSDTKILQFTGLVDKHGKEVYEGMLVPVPNEYPQTETDPAEPYFELGVIDFKNGRFGVVVPNAPMRGYSNKFFQDLREPEFLDFFDAWDDVSKEMEVVGNIYENPNMLKEWNN